MSSPVSALGDRTVHGTVKLRSRGVQGMITLRADLAARKLRQAVTGLTGLDAPGQGEIARSDSHGLAWMSPDEMLILLPYEDVPGAMDTLAAKVKGLHHLAQNVSDARAVIRLEGAGAREVLAKLAPVDLHPDSLPPGRIIRSRLGQVAAAFWFRDAALAEVICFRSTADYTFRLLEDAARAGPVGHFPDR